MADNRVREGALVITGPTASGKSALALGLAKYIDIEIISADSAQVYRGMDIGTAKPNPHVLASLPHHLVDIRDPVEPYSAADFRHDLLDIVPQIRSRGRLPVIVGGSMLYLKALKNGLAELPGADPSIRESINEDAAARGWSALHEDLQVIDPEAAERIKPSDTQRLQRALEVYRITGITLTELHRRSMAPCPFPLTEVGLLPTDRSKLHQVIQDRFMEMLNLGLIEEVATLKSNSENHKGLPAFRAVGYRQIWSYLDGEVDYDTMIETGIAATRQLAKRQYTWLRSWQDLVIQSRPNLAEVLKILDDDPRL